MSAAAPFPCQCPAPTLTPPLCCLLHADGFYHVGHAFLSDRANHIHALLEARGYARYESELFFEWRDYTAADLLALLPPDTDGARPSVEALCPAGLRVSFEAIEGRGARPNGTLRIHDAEGELVGICECLSAGERSESPAAQDWMLVSWLGVPPSPTVEAYADHASQGRGRGKYALVAAMEAMLTLGYRHGADQSLRSRTPIVSPIPDADVLAQRRSARGASRQRRRLTMPTPAPSCSMRTLAVSLWRTSPTASRAACNQAPRSDQTPLVL